MLISTSALIAATPSRTCAISRSSGPRTAATMQNSLAPVAAVSFAASTSDAMSSHAARTGVGKRPDCEQKWQSSGQPPVFTDTMPSTSTSGPHHRSRTSCASASASSSRSSGSSSTASVCASSSPRPLLQNLQPRHGQDVRLLLSSAAAFPAGLNGDGHAEPFLGAGVIPAVCTIDAYSGGAGLKVRHIEIGRWSWSHGGWSHGGWSHCGSIRPRARVLRAAHRSAPWRPGSSARARFPPRAPR